MGITYWLRSVVRTLGWLLIFLGTTLVISAWSVAFPTRLG
jgi:hypothetical protein